MPRRWTDAKILGSVCLLLVLSSCTGEDAVPLDLGSTPPTSHGVGAGDEAEGSDSTTDPNEAQRQLVIGYAEQQCLDDPDLEEGYVAILVPDTEEKVGEVSVDCAEVRSRPE